MATAKELLEKAIDAGAYVPDSVIADYEKNALTKSLADKAFGEKYASQSWAKDAEDVAGVIPDVETILNALDIQKEDERSRKQVFIEDFPKKQKDWQKKIEKNPEWGKDGWNTIVSEWKRASIDKMNEDIKKARREATDQSLFDKYVSLMWPRAVEHIAETGDFTAKDMALDLAENLGMSVPGGVFTGLGAKALGKVAPKVVRYLSGPGSNILQSAVKGAGQMAGNIAGNAVVPFGAEAMDAAAYGDDDIGMENRSDFSWGDAATGTLINQTVNRGLMKYAGPLMDRFSPGGMARGGMAKARQFLENLGRSQKELGDDFANRVRATDRILNIREPGQVTLGDIKNFNKGGKAGEALSLSDADKAFLQAQVLDEMDKGVIYPNSKETIDKASAALNNQRTKKILSEIADNDYEISRKTEKFEKLKKQIVDYDNEIAKAKPATDKAENATKGKAGDDIGKLRKTRNSLIAQRDKMDEQINDLSTKNVILKNRANKDLGYMEAEQIFMRDPTNNNGLSDKVMYDALNKNIDEFKNYAKWHSKVNGPTASDRILNTLNQALPAWGVNKVGKDEHAKAVLNMLPGLKQTIAENIKETHEAPKNRKSESAARNILEGLRVENELTGDDQRFLERIAKKPSIVQFGLPANDPDRDSFALWLLTRGNDLLKNTSAYRSPWKVE